MPESESKQDHTKSLLGKAVDNQLLKNGISRESIFEDFENIQKSVYFGLRTKWVDETSDKILAELAEKKLSTFKKGVLLGFWAIDESQISKRQGMVVESIRYRAIEKALYKLFGE